MQHFQCDHLEDELNALLMRRRAVLINALDSLHQYRNVTAQVGVAVLSLCVCGCVLCMCVFAWLCMVVVTCV